MSLRSLWCFLEVIVLQAVLLGLLALIIPGFRFEDPVLLIPAALTLTAGQSLIWPFIYAVAARFGPWLFPLLSFILTGALISAAAWVNDRYGIGGVEVADLGTGILVALGLSIGNTILAAVFSIDDELTYDRMVTEPLRRRFADVPKTNEPGFLFLEIDGLSLPVLQDAIARGYMPTLQRWLDSGSHKVVRWDPDLSSQTSASQAGILLGSNEGIPAFRWWDKPRQELMVSSKMRTAHTLELALSNGNGLLAPDGAGRWNAFSGNAADNIGVFSVFGDASRGSDNTLLGYLLSPYMLGRMLTLYVIDVGRELWEAWQQRRQNVLPRVHRGLKYAFIRAGTTTVMQEASRYILTADMLRGIPAVYNTFFGYDEVAHHSGIDREDSLKVLRTIDTIFAHLERVAKEAPRPYHLIVLSDHGQSQGATFLQKYGKTLGEVTNELIEDHGITSLTEIAHDDEAMGHVNAALSQAIHAPTPTARMLRGLLRRRTMDGEVALWKRRDDVRLSDGSGVTDVIVLASGNLGVISFPQWKGLLTFEQIEEAFPDLLPGLIDHPGISLALVTSEQHGPLAIGKKGVYFLKTDKVEGKDPLAQFGPHAARHLRREAEFPNVPDIVVISTVDPETGEVPAFEELVGNHGGLGGWQREPFLLYPAEFDPGPEMIVGAGHLHSVLLEWMKRSRSREWERQVAPRLTANSQQPIANNGAAEGSGRMTMSYQEANRESLQRLQTLVSRLDDETIVRQLDDDWTVGAVLAHLAFWDESCAQRWEAFDREGAFVSLNREVVDLINAANLPTWRALPGNAVRDLVLQAAEAADARTENLSPQALAYAEETGRTFILDRASHRTEHLEQIERALAG